MVEQRIYIPYATDNWLVLVRIQVGVPFSIINILNKVVDTVIVLCYNIYIH